VIAPEAKALIDLLVCPRSHDALKLIVVGDEEALVCPATGVVYPIIDNVVIMNPVTRELKDRCNAFLQRVESALDSINEHLDLEKTREALALGPGTSVGWEEEEMAYWEEFFKQRSEELSSVRGNWNRTLPRQRLIQRQSIVLTEKVVLELGCGGATTLFDLYGSSFCHYIGADLSLHACKLAQIQFPEGLFIQCSAIALPFKENSLDIIVAYGVLHHLPGHEEQMNANLPLLKPGGYFIGSDPVLKPPIEFWGIGKKLKSIAPSGFAEKIKTGASPHNEWIDWENFLKVIDKRARVIDTHFEYGPLRAVLVNLIYDGLKLRTRMVSRALIVIDQLWLATIGKLNRSLGPAGVIYILRKLPSRLTS
jgi:SAM-dependent methyltransferase/uncharacterized protein YbaR (Trm112 family)